MASTLFRHATILTMNDRLDVIQGDVLVQGRTIAAVGPAIDAAADRVVDAAETYLIPGFVQTHLHLCQTIFRGYAEDLPLLEWLRRCVWPLEAAHTPATLRASARLAAAELLLSGTTAVLTMETVRDTDAVCEALIDTGLRATVGKSMLDADDLAPPRMRETAAESIAESLALRRQWHGAADGRLRIAFAPRFAVSCSRELLEGVAAAAVGESMLVHTHASESAAELAVVRALSGGLTNLEYLARTGLASPRLCAAHCVWVDEDEQRLVAEHDIKVMHCPGSNLKLGSGIAPVAALRRRGVCVSLGADGAACNNRLDMFGEMRLAATLQAVRERPGALTARDALTMATRDGARTLGLEAEIGTVEPGKRADLVLIARHRLATCPDPDPFTTIVFAATAADVRLTMVDGRILVDRGTLTHLDGAEIRQMAAAAAREVAARAGLG